MISPSRHRNPLRLMKMIPLKAHLSSPLVRLLRTRLPGSGQPKTIGHGHRAFLERCIIPLVGKQWSLTLAVGGGSWVLLGVRWVLAV